MQTVKRKILDKNVCNIMNILANVEKCAIIIVI